MSGRYLYKWLALVVLVVVAVSGYAVLAQSDTSIDSFQIEVAEDGNRFVFGQERLHDDGMPAYGTPFVTEGFLYPVGTLNGSNGVLPNGEPEFPDKVIGTWTCWGWMIGDGAHTETGAWVVSSQVYQFNDAYGNASIITDGLEIIDVDVAGSRAISGGTGQYASVTGEQIQELKGFTDQMGVVLTVEFNFDAGA